MGFPGRSRCTANLTPCVTTTLITWARIRSEPRWVSGCLAGDEAGGVGADGKAHLDPAVAQVAAHLVERPRPARGGAFGHLVVGRVHGQRQSAADAERDRRVDRRQPLRVEQEVVKEVGEGVRLAGRRCGLRKDASWRSCEARTRIAATSGARCDHARTHHTLLPRAAAPRRFTRTRPRDWTRAAAERENRGLMSFWRRVALCALVALVACAAAAAAQAGTATLTLTVTLPDGAIASGAQIEVAPPGAGAVRAGDDHGRTLDGRAAADARASPRARRVRRVSHLRSRPRIWRRARERRLAVRLMPETGMGDSTIAVERRYETTYQTEPRAPSGSPTCRAAARCGRSSTPPTRSSSRTAWTTAACGARGPRSLAGRVRRGTRRSSSLDGLDVTDPRSGGAPAIYPDLGLFEAVQVETARLTADAAGPGSGDHPRAAPPG